MKKLILIGLVLTMFTSCDDENLFDTREVGPPTVTATEWLASAIDTDGNVIHSTGFAEAGRLFRLPGPNNDSTSTAYREIRVETLLNSGNERLIDSVTIEFRWIPSFPSNSSQPWVVFDGISVPIAERATEYQFGYQFNLDSWMDDYICLAYGLCGFGIDWNTIGPFFGINVIRDDNMMRLTLHFNDGSRETIAQVQFGLPKTPAGII